MTEIFDKTFRPRKFLFLKPILLFYRKRYNKVVDGITMFQKAYRKYKHDKRFIRSQRNELNRIQARQREYLSRFDPQSSDNQVRPLVFIYSHPARKLNLFKGRHQFTI